MSSKDLAPGKAPFVFHRERQPPRHAHASRAWGSSSDVACTAPGLPQRRPAMPVLALQLIRFQLPVVSRNLILIRILITYLRLVFPKRYLFE